MEQTTTTASQPKPILVIDTNAFIRCLDIQKYSEKYELYTSNNVLNEIKDKAARDKFNSLNIDIKTASGDEKSFAFVDDFSKRTGDYSSLSFTDKELIAIAVHLTKQRGNEDKLRKQPPELKEWVPIQAQEVEEEEEEPEKPEVDDDGFKTVTKGKVLTMDDIKPKKGKKPVQDDDGFVTVQPKKGKNAAEEEEEEESGEEQTEEAQENLEGIVLEKITDQQVESELANNGEQAAAAAEDDDSSDDDDDGKDWINPDNISKKLYRGTKNEDRVEEVGVAVMTSDFAMQNVIIQIGLPLISTEGYIIKQTRRFVLECYCCEKICKDPTKQFCPSCGNPTLKKLSIHVNDDGLITFYKSGRRKINNRGKIYSIPLSQGGRKSNDLLLREDEFLMKGRLQQLERQEKEKDKKFRQRLKDYENGLTFDDINLKHKYLANKIQIGYGRVNPNDKNQLRKHHK